MSRTGRQYDVDRTYYFEGKYDNEGVLVAVSIPIFTARLEKAREATDVANLPAKYTAVMVCALTEEMMKQRLPLTASRLRLWMGRSLLWKLQKAQQQIDLQSSVDGIGGVAIADIPAQSLTGWTITYKEDDISIKFAGNN